MSKIALTLAVASATVVGLDAYSRVLTHGLVRAPRTYLRSLPGAYLVRH